MSNVLERLRGLRLPAGTGPVGLLIVSALGVAAVLWGVFFANPDITVVQYDAGPIADYEIRQMNAFPEIDLYLFGLDSGAIRALDGRVEASGCRVVWLPEDPRARGRNPGAMLGAFEDLCSGAIWSVEGNAVSGSTEPLRTPRVSFLPNADGRLHVTVELVNHPLGKR